MNSTKIKPTIIEQFLFTDNRSAVLWLALRLYVGWIWLGSGFGKITNPAWVGENSGEALTGFVRGAVGKASAENPTVHSWYANFLSEAVLPNAEIFSYLVAFGEFFVGAALILGIFVGISAFFGFFMNMNFLLAGTISSNPVLLVLSLFLVFAWRVAGYLGLDYFLLPWTDRLCREKIGFNKKKQ